MEIKHRFISPVADDPEAKAAGQVAPSDWNNTHDMQVAAKSLVGNDQTAQATAKDIAVGAGLQILNGVLSATNGPQQQVYIGSPTPLPAYPALIFNAVTIGGKSYYKMQVTDGNP